MAAWDESWGLSAPLVTFASRAVGYSLTCENCMAYLRHNAALADQQVIPPHPIDWTVRVRGGAVRGFNLRNVAPRLEIEPGIGEVPCLACDATAI